MPEPTIATAPIPSNVCAQMVESATQSCQPLISVPPEAANPNWDAMAVSFSALSTAFTFGSIILAVLAVIAGFAWAKIVAANAEAEAKKVAKQCADDYIQSWLAKEAPGIIRERVDLILDATLGPGDDAKAADELGKGAG